MQNTDHGVPPAEDGAGMRASAIGMAASLLLAAGALAPDTSLAAKQDPKKVNSCSSLAEEWLSKPEGSYEREVLEGVMWAHGCDEDGDGLLSVWEREIYGTDPDDPDTDADGLWDGPEVFTHLTDPLDADTDGDSLVDGWEVNGHPNGTALPGANPRRADIYVEMDYMVRATATNGLAWNQAVLDGIVEVFGNAPITNPDGSTGVSIHLDQGNEVTYDDNLYPYDTEFNAIRATHFDPLRRPVYHYMVWANRYNYGTSSGVSFGIPAADFLVTLGGWNSNAGGTDAQKIGTFIHELGHNLGLRHGGDDHENWKPNYLSVMNYSFQVVGVPGPTGPLFDYQRFDLPALNEAALSEANGLNASSDWDGYGTTYFCESPYQRRTVTSLTNIDWNCSGAIDAGTVASDVNDSGYRSVLGTQNNWANIVFDGNGLIGEGMAATQRRDSSRTSIQSEDMLQLEPELTWEQVVDQDATP